MIGGKIQFVYKARLELDLDLLPTNTLRGDGDTNVYLDVFTKTPWFKLYQWLIC